MSTVVTLPHLGESVVEGTVLKWLVAVGDLVARDQPLVEIGTDKTDTEVVAPASGRVVSLAIAEGQTARVGATLATIDETARVDAPALALAGPAPALAGPAPAPAGAAPATSAASPAAPRPEAASAPAAAPAPAAPAAPPRASPAVRKLAHESGVALGDVAASGLGGRITAEDVRRAAEPAPARATAPRDEAPSPSPQAPATGDRASAFVLPPYASRPGDQVVPFSRRRRIIADHMVFSKRVSPHVLTVAEVDMHAAHTLREAHKATFQAEGIPLTFLAFVAAATARALREFPLLNSRVLDDAYVMLKEIHLGIAVETDDGLIVPVVRNADELTLRGIARAIDDVAQRARKGKLGPDDLAGKTFTLSNPGRKGNLFGAAIISQPNVAILRIGEIRKRVVVVEHDGQDLMAIHPVMHLALSYDHRIVDGFAANSFLWRLRDLLERGQDQPI
ncbi:MAG: 2-oxo acid dehydrogenase subunit E2 [Deltaproteobacteria bacterium]|nr:2-oxo acid dehydrogenase subunit E2 [Deltaproteobacteria bacterium]